MATSFRAFSLLLTLYAYQALAGTQSVTIDVGGTQIYVPAPNSFHEVSQLSPETRKLAETMTPPDNRLLAVFVSEADLGRIMKGESPQLYRYMYLQVFRELEKSGLTAAEFQQLGNQVKQQQETLLEKVRSRVGSLVDSASAKLSKERNIPLKIQFGEQAPLGVFLNNSDAIGFASLARVRVSANGKQVDDVIASGVSFIRVKGKLLFAYVYGKYDDQQDVEWVRTTSINWLAHLSSSNASQATTQTTQYSASTISNIDWDRVFLKGIGGALMGGLVGLAWGVSRFLRKRSHKTKNHDGA